MTTLLNLKTGDSVFVVQQKSRHVTEERVSTETITRVGRKYAYFKKYSEEEGAKFCRETGRSAHTGDHNVRANGGGFDVYLCEADYRRKQSNAIAKRRLEKRIVGSFGGIVDLSPEIIEQFNRILDLAGLD